MSKIVHILSLMLFLAGCSTTLVREDPHVIALGETGVKCATAPLVSALLERRGVTAQALSGHWKERVFTAECVLKGEDDRFTAVFLAPHMRLATLTLTPPHTVSFERARQIPAAFEPEYLLFDLAVVNLSADRLRRALGGAFRVEERGNVRRVCAGGREVAVFARESDGRSVYENHVFEYGYTIKEMH